MPQGDGTTKFRGRSRNSAVGVVALVIGLALPAGASTDSAVPWTSFSESTSCGRPYVGTPIMSKIGSLSDSERILGPLGRYLGRTVGEVRASLVDWVVPMSGGLRARVHRAALPAFEQVTINLAAAAGQGLWYSVSDAYAFTPRTIGGSHQLSRHALGIAIDINTAHNPYSSSTLITDMPEWYVQAWRDAGFCWGGDWIFSKDAMHFAWMGPAPGSGGLPGLAPLGVQAPYAATDTYPTGWAAYAASGQMAIADMTATGAADLVRFRDHPKGLVVEALSARSAFGRCSLSRWMVQGMAVADGLLALGDVDGDSRVDLVSVSPTGRAVVVRRPLAFGTPVISDVPVPAGLRSVLVADHDGDRRGDLFLVGESGAVTILAGPEFTSVLATANLPVPFDWVAAGDRDGDGHMELFTVDTSGVVSVLEDGSDGSFVVIEQASINVQGAVAVEATDLDGDQRADLAVLTGDGSLRVWVGNSTTGRTTSAWWVNPGYDCPNYPVPLEYQGVFYDDDPTLYEDVIERIAAAGITTGCNPPFSDAYCPGRPVTRGQMASFLGRAFALPAAADDPFWDDDGSQHEPDIARIAAAGITFGCAAGQFCPDARITRGEMAAFLVRAGSLPAADSVDAFSDDDGSPFEADINALAAAGVTEGCAPDRFCPHGAVTRAEMAAFLVRLLDL
ncbi:MAG: S-layer homology domain-containing protein [Acidimicrobiia bacterium]